MKPLHDKNETSAQWAWLGNCMAALTRHTVVRIRLPLAHSPRPLQGAELPSGTAGRADTPFADTEASWHSL